MEPVQYLRTRALLVQSNTPKMCPNKGLVSPGYESRLDGKFGHDGSRLEALALFSELTSFDAAFLEIADGQ